MLREGAAKTIGEGLRMAYCSLLEAGLMQGLSSRIRSQQPGRQPCSTWTELKVAPAVLLQCCSSWRGLPSLTCRPPQLMEASTPVTLRAALGPLSRRRISEVMQGIKLSTCCLPKDRPKLSRRMRTNSGALQWMSEGWELGSLQNGGRHQGLRGRPA